MENIMNTITQEKVEVKETKIILPPNGVIKDKDGKSAWGRTQYVFPFKSKEEYLTWRQVWKDTYMPIAYESREAKILRNNGFRNKTEDGPKYQGQVISMKEEARSLLEILKQGKALSWQQKQQSK